MDKAPDFGSGDCRFESCHGRKPFSFLSSPLSLSEKEGEILLLQMFLHVFIKNDKADFKTSVVPQFFIF